MPSHACKIELSDDRDHMARGAAIDPLWTNNMQDQGVHVARKLQELSSLSRSCDFCPCKTSTPLGMSSSTESEPKTRAIYNAHHRLYCKPYAITNDCWFSISVGTEVTSPETEVLMNEDQR